MGKPATRVGDMQSGHGCFPPTNAIKGTSNVFINGKPAMIVGGQYVTHCCPLPGCHPVILGSGSGTVSINGAPAGRIGDKIACGGSVITGSSNVFIGG